MTSLQLLVSVLLIQEERRRFSSLSLRLLDYLLLVESLGLEYVGIKQI